MENKKIIHIDMDAFYASIEQRDHPEYRGKPLAVGRAEKRGVVAAASYEARRYGVRSAMSSMKAKQLCPDLIFVSSGMEHYKSVSHQIHEIFREYTDIIEPLALDEAFLDVTENKKGITLAVDVAREIKREIKEKLGLIASAGVSYNKFLAKIASDYRKPDGLYTIHPERAADFIANRSFLGYRESYRPKNAFARNTHGGRPSQMFRGFSRSQFREKRGSIPRFRAWNRPSNCFPRTYPQISGLRKYLRQRLDKLYRRYHRVVPRGS